jgi:DNA repair exonuclease SbcCD ATPase subunit
MHNFDNFIDLRLNRRRQNDDSSLWPSFTDIMTVILMIFMLTMIVVIVKNANLAKELTVSQNEAQNLQSLLEETRTDREALKIVITNLEEKLRAQQMEIILLGDENKVVQSTLEAKVALISALQKQLSEIQADAEKLASRLTAAEAEKEALASRYEEQMKAISTETERQIEEFNRKFAALEDKYQRLIRPARSPLGKEVVTVQYSRQDGQYRILYKEPQSDDFEPVGREELQTRLDRLKSRWQDKLYIKIVIPEQSGLSYNEAWNFTRNILSRYDYYYQERNPTESQDKAPLPGGL